MLEFTAKGYYTWIVLNEKDKIVNYAPTYSHNLILDQGLDGIAVRSWADSFVACAVGTNGATPVKSQIGLVAEAKRTNTYLDMTDANSSTLSGSDFTMRRTFVFSREVGDVVYKEAGFSYSASGPNALFSRVRLPNVSVFSGERIIIQYELVVTVTPTSSTAKNNPITATQGTSGVFQFQRLGLKGVNSLGQTYNFDDAEGCNEPSTSAKAFLSTNSSAPAVFGSVVNRSGTTYESDTTPSTYTAGSFSISKIFSANKIQAQNTAWRSLGLGAASGNSFSKTGLVHVFNSNFNKGRGILIVAFNLIWSAPDKDKFRSLFYWQDEDQLVLRKQNALLNYFGQNDA